MPPLTNRFSLCSFHFILFGLFLVFNAGYAQQSPYAALALPDGSLLAKKGTPNLVLVIGQSTCPACQSDHSALKLYHKKWEKMGHALVYLSIDREVEKYTAYYGEDPWETHHDSLRWDGVLATELKLIGTPSLYAFDKDMKLLKETENAHQMHFWMVGRGTK